MDYQDLKQKISSKTKLFFLCSPHNPTGRVWNKKELKQLGEICLENNIIVIADEIHSDLVYPDYKHTPFPMVDKKFKQNSIVCSSPSKTFNFPGFQPGNMIIADKKIRTIYHNQLERFDFHHHNIAAQEATKAVYQNGKGWLEKLIQYLEDNLKLLKSHIENEIPRIKVIKPQGTYLVWLDFRSINLNSKKLNHLLKKKAQIKLTPGHTFGQPGEGFQRINIACPRSQLKETLKRLTSFMHNVEQYV